MKNSVKLKIGMAVFGGFTVLSFWACAKPDKIDKRVYGRWKITQYYLDGQLANDTIDKYQLGYEYDIKQATPSKEFDINAVIHTYYQGEHAGYDLKNMGSYGVSFAFTRTAAPAPKCPVGPDVVIIGGDTATGCFECAGRWKFSLDGDNSMVWNAESVSSSPLEHTHKLIFTKIN